MRTLGELFEICAGKTMSAAARNGPNKTPFLRTSNVHWDEVDLSSVDEMWIPEHELPAKLLRPGDLLVCEGGEIGRAAVWYGDVDPMSFQNHLHCLRPIDDVEPRFYVYFLQCAFTQLGIFEGAGNKTTIPNLSRSRLATLKVPCPHIDEQRKIVAVLAWVCDAAKTQGNIIKTMQELKRSSLQRLFTRGLSGGPLNETEIGAVPSSWNIVYFGELCERIQYGTSTKCTYEESPHPVLRIPNIEPTNIRLNDLKYCSLSDREATRFRLNSGDLLFIRTNGAIDRLGSCAVYFGEPPNALFASYIIRAQLKRDRVNPRFVASFLSSETGGDVIASRAVPASDGKYNLNTAAISDLPVPMPRTLREQNEIVLILDTIDRKIDLHRRKRVVLEDLFDTLLYGLMTWEIRVSDLDLSALAAIGAD